MYNYYINYVYNYNYIIFLACCYVVAMHYIGSFITMPSFQNSDAHVA